MMLAAYLPWFGRPGHINVGYSSQDRVVMEKQIEKARQLGISAFVVNWYWAHHDFEDKAYTLMQGVAADNNFEVALMYDEDDADPAGETAQGTHRARVTVPCILHRQRSQRPARVARQR